MTDPAAPAPAALDAPPEKPRGTGGEALDWWRYYCDPGHPKYDPGTRAQLRRCDSPVDAAAIPAAVNLARRLGAFADDADDQRVKTALDLARVLAHVREHAPGPPMRAAGWERFGDWDKADARRPVLSEVRFRRLLTTGPGEEQVAAFVRLIALLDGAVDVAILGAHFLDWSHPSRGERVRRQWAEDYFAARVPRPASVSPSPSPASIPTEDDA